jgi:hypothetical protein
VQAAAADGSFALCPHRDVRFHNWRGLCDAEINKVTNPALDRSFNRSQAGYAVNVLEFFRLGRAGMRDPDQLHEHVSWRDLPAIRPGIESVTLDYLAAWGELAFGSDTGERSNFMPAFQQMPDEWPSEVTGASGHKHSAFHHGNIPNTDSASASPAVTIANPHVVRF